VEPALYLITATVLTSRIPSLRQPIHHRLAWRVNTRDGIDAGGRRSLGTLAAPIHGAADSRRGVFALIWSSLLLLIPLRLAALDLFVAPAGSDANAGTQAAPFATLGKARDAIRTLKTGAGLPAEGVTVWLRGGLHDLAATVGFDNRDSGTASLPVTYAGWPGEEARITGGRSLDAAACRLVYSGSVVWKRLDPAARGQVYELDLRRQGVSDFGTLHPRGFGISAAAPLELFIDGRPMTLAQWPNRRDPWARTVATASSTQFTYAGSRPERWSQAAEVWLQGFWRHAWADFQLQVAAIDPARKSITLAAPPAAYGLDADRPFIAYNLLEEIDEPGEYFVDRSSGTLYFWPPAALAAARIQVSVLEAPLLQFAGAQHVTWRDVIIEAGRGGLVRIDSGDHLRFERCLLRNAGQYAAQVAGTANGLDHCEVVDCGADGVRIAGGNRATLTAGENYVTNCRLHRVSRLIWTGFPAISLNGCGHRAANNLIDDLPSTAIVLFGNNHVVELNEIRRVCRTTSDAGAIYIGRDWGYRGNVIRTNFIHHIQTSQEGAGVHGVYLDDCVSGVEASGNVFHRIDDIALMAGGGRDLIMRGNLIAACGFGHRNDDRGRTRITNTPGDSWNLLARLALDGIRYQAPPWSTAFPACAAIPNSWESIVQGLWRNPENCEFTGNAGWANTTWTAESNPSGTGVFGVYATMANNTPSQAPLFDDAASLDRALRPAELRAAVPGFAAIPFAAIGRTWPQAQVATAPPPVPLLDGQALSSTQIDLQWTDDGNLARVQETGFMLERRNEPSGAWGPVRSFGPDVDFASQAGLAPGTRYSYRVRVANAAGAGVSNVLTLTTRPAPWLAGSATRYEAETAFTVVSDVGALGTVGVSNATLDSGQSVRLYDPGDTLRIPFTITTPGAYRIGVRVRSGSAGGPATFWPNSYSFRLDGDYIVLRGDTTTLSAQDPGYGVSYWGMMVVDAPTLAAGPHAIEVRAVGSFSVVDYLEVAPLSPRAIVTFPDWQAARFSADQLADAATSSALSVPSGATAPNLLAYALGLDPWSAVAGNGLRVATVSGQLRLTYARPLGLSDLNYTVESSADALTWAPLPQTSLAQDRGWEMMQATDASGPGDARRYLRLRVNRGSQFVTSETFSNAQLSAAAPSPRLGNLSARVVAGTGANVVVTGFNLAGAGRKQLLIRGIGPGLAAFGLSTALVDPMLQVVQGGTKFAENDNWSEIPSEAAVFALAAARLGGFPLASGSRDAVTLAALGPGGYSAVTTGVGSSTGLALAELYDADNEPLTSSVRLVNLSARAAVGTGSDILVAGFSLIGAGNQLVLVRAVGPALARFGIESPLLDPRLEVYSGATVIAANDNWGSQSNGGTVATIQAAAARVGAFPLDPGTNDAALLLILAPGTYTTQISGLNNSTGVALVELYEVL
jgi:hypothetical protein